MTGWAIPGVRMRVVDAEGSDVRPDGEQIGEIVVRGNTVMDGYYHDPDATAATIRDGWLYTGDMATIDEAGYVLIKDRSKDIIISSGENMSSVEIEVALGSHPSVLECAVVAAPDDKRGEVPVAIVVLKPDMAASAGSCELTAANGSPPTRSRASFTSEKHCPRAARARSSRPSCVSRSGRDRVASPLRARLFRLEPTARLQAAS